MNEMVIVMGPPASGKSTQIAKYPNYIRLNRDTEGGRVIDLLPKMVAHLKNGDNVVLDNLFARAAERKPFLDAANQLGVITTCVFVNTSIEDCQINVLHRMQMNHGQLFMSASQMKGVKDPGVFPAAVLFKWRQDFEKPTTTEGFSKILTIPFVRRWDTHYKNKAIILDYDGTLRTVKNGEYKYPTSVDQVEMLPGRAEVLKKYQDNGYILAGASNQSGIAKGIVAEEIAIACFVRVNELTGLNIDYTYCPHAVPPISCWCRKPQSAQGMYHIERHHLNPALCIVVGDQTTDATFARRLGMQFQTPKQFFGC